MDLSPFFLLLTYSYSQTRSKQRTHLWSLTPVLIYGSITVSGASNSLGMVLAACKDGPRQENNMDTARTASRSNFPFTYYSLRNISCPEDQDADRKVYSGHAPAASFLDLPTDENVRGYLVEAEGKVRRTPTQVHRQIRDTLQNKPGNFSILNGGIVIVARGVEVDEKTKIAHLRRPSIINGSQTQGELKHYFDDMDKNEEKPFPVHVTFELIVTDDDDLIGEISIARNFQNDVALLSIVGRREQLEELEASLQRSDPSLQLRKSETQRSEDYLDTEKLLQVITALIPEELWPKPKESGSPNKVYTYSMKAKCLRDYQVVYRKAKDAKDSDHKQSADLYQFYLDIAPQAYQLYTKWKTHSGFSGTGLRAIERDDKRRIIDVPDGIVFPILASFAAFAKKTRQGWRIQPPEAFRDEEIIRAAKSVYQEIANSNPWNMGKSKACYSSLYQITSIYKRLTAA